MELGFQISIIRGILRSFAELRIPMFRILNSTRKISHIPDYTSKHFPAFVTRITLHKSITRSSSFVVFGSLTRMSQFDSDAFSLFPQFCEIDHSRTYIGTSKKRRFGQKSVALLYTIIDYILIQTTYFYVCLKL